MENNNKLEQKKDIHIVFQVFNFIQDNPSCPYLSSKEEILLLTLARFKGDKGIYPSIHTLSKKLKKHRTNIIKTLQTLEKKNLIIIEKNIGKSNFYSLNLSTASSETATSSEITTSSETTTTPVAISLQTSSDIATRSDNRYNLKEQRESARKTRAPLSDLFSPNQRLNNLWTETASKSGKTKDQLLTKFKNLQKSKDGNSSDWDSVFENYLINEKPMGYTNGNGKSNGHAANEIKSTVPFFGKGHATFDEHERVNEEMKKQGLIKKPIEPEVKDYKSEHISFKERVIKHGLKTQQGKLKDEEIPRDRSGNCNILEPERILLPQREMVAKDSNDLG